LPVRQKLSRVSSVNFSSVTSLCTRLYFTAGEKSAEDESVTGDADADGSGNEERRREEDGR